MDNYLWFPSVFLRLSQMMLTHFDQSVADVDIYREEIQNPKRKYCRIQSTVSEMSTDMELSSLFAF
jgi:hypothetical protein